MTPEPSPASDTARDSAWSAYNKDQQWGHEPTAKGLFLDGYEAATAALRREVEELRAERDAFLSAVEYWQTQSSNQAAATEVEIARGKRWCTDFIAMRKERDTALAQLAEATKERDEARARVKTLKIKLVSLSDVLPEWSTADWEYAEGTNPRLIAGEFTFGDALALRAAIDAAGGKCRECGSVLPKHQADCGLDAPV